MSNAATRTADAGQNARGARALDLHDWVEAYVSERRGLGHITASTAQGARNVLTQMARMLPDNPKDVTVVHLRRWLVHNDRDGGPVSPRTVALRTTRARHFFAWLEEMDVIERSPARMLEAPRVPKGEPRFLEHGEVTALARVARTPRDLAMVLLMVQMGLRRVEIHRALVTDVQSGRLAVRGKGGDGAVTRWVPIPSEAQKALDQWMQFRPKGTDVLFATTTGKPLALGWISRKVSDMMREAGVKTRSGDGRSAHALRHTMAQHLVDDGTPLRIVQKILGHSSVTTTEMYARREVQVLADVLEGRNYMERPA